MAKRKRTSQDKSIQIVKKDPVLPPAEAIALNAKMETFNPPPVPAQPVHLGTTSDLALKVLRSDINDLTRKLKISERARQSLSERLAETNSINSILEQFNERMMWFLFFLVIANVVYGLYIWGEVFHR